MATPLERYKAKVDALLTQQDKLTDEQIRRAFRLLADSRRSVLDELAKIAGDNDTSFKAWQLRDLRDAIDRQSAHLVGAYRPVMGGAVERAWEDGLQLQPAALKAAGVEFVVRREISRDQLVVAQEVAADMVTQVTEEFRTQARQIVARGVLGALQPHVVMRLIQGLLETQPNRKTGRLGSIASQAERTMRTELMGVFSISNEMRHRQIAEEVPDLSKYWRTAGDGRVRHDHQVAGRIYAPGSDPGPIPQGDDFVVGGERAAFPHDPRLTAKQRVN